MNRTNQVQPNSESTQEHKENMLKNTNQPSSLVYSHIQMPKLLLKRFLNEQNKFFYYDVSKKFIGKNGTAKSTNTEYGYYSIDTEHYLRDNIETPFGEILSDIDNVDFEQGCFSMPKNFTETTKNFIYALLSRDPDMLQKIKQHSTFAQFYHERTLHDYAAINVIDIAERNKLFAEYIVTFMENRTGTPFVLPIKGLFEYTLNGHSIINLPISPTRAICLVHKDHSNYLIQKDGTKAMFMVNISEQIKKINESAFLAQKRQNQGVVICPQQEELTRLSKMNLN